jgi:hypothetical protein
MVFRPSSAEPLFARHVGEATIEAPATRGPGRARGYFPLAIRSGADRLWLAWNGAALEEQRATP